MKNIPAFIIVALCGALIGFSVFSELHHVADALHVALTAQVAK
ncbi:hypothetical protein [Burkholderia ubonensis]|nr:hypothetical protein [Burkholderia ubonensis]